MFVARKFYKSSIRRNIDMVIRMYQVTVIGGASDIGQVVSLMLRAEPSVKSLLIHDLRDNTPGIVLDLSHIPVNSALRGYSGTFTMERALKDSDLVIIAGGAIKTPGITDKARLEENTTFIKSIASKIGKIVPMPFVGIVTEPVNVLVPMAAEIMRYNGSYDPRKLFGITTIDSLRAQSLYAADNQVPPSNCFVPIIGGHSNKTIIPLLSHSRPTFDMNEKDVMNFTMKIQNYDDIVTEAKPGWSPTMSVAYSVLMFTREIINALEGRPAQVNAFVENNDFGTSFFGGLIHIDKEGVKEMQRFTNISQYECHLLEKATEQLRKDVATGKRVLETDSQQPEA